MGKKKKPKSTRDDRRDDRVFKAMANGDRRRILDALRENPKTTGELCECIAHLDRCTVMLHLRTLEQAELIISKKEGKFRWNYLNVHPIQMIYQRWIRDYAQPAADLLSQLKTQLESS